MLTANWFNRQIGPLYRLALRLWLAAPLVPAVLATGMLPSMTANMLPRPAAATAAALLALGLCTPIVAAILLVSAGMAMTSSDQGMTLYGPLLLALIGVSGAGRYSVDYSALRIVHCRWRTVHRMSSSSARASAGWPARQGCDMRACGLR